MKKFTDICKMSQKEVKSYMRQYLTAKNYKPIIGDGFLYAKGDVPVLLVAHMDTVHKEQCNKFIWNGDKISAKEGIGGDDRCGIFIIMNIVNSLHCSVLLCEDEEVGGIGASEFTKTEHIKNLGVNYMIEFDRKGHNDAVFYDCDNPEFEKFVINNTGFKTAHGSFSDISYLAPAAEIAAVNLSSGYYNAHTTSEYVMYNEMMNVVEVGKKLIKAECNEPFKYIKRKYTKDYAYSLFDNWEDEYFDGYSMYVDKKKKKKVDFDLELEVVYMNMYGYEEVEYVTGRTKEECWAKFFLTCTNVSFDNITDYTFM